MPAVARPPLTAVVAAVGAAALIAAPTATPAPEPAAAPEIRLSAAQTITPAFREIVEAAASRALPSPPPPPVSGPTTQNALSNAIINAWDVAVPWIDYGVEVADYVLGFVPLGYLISDQINIFYDSLFPIADSFVRDLLAPVVDQPLNLAVWVDGISDLVATTVSSVINLGINEFNYFFGWLIPPIPPIGPLQTVALEAEPETVAPLSAEEGAEVTIATVAVPVEEVGDESVVTGPVTAGAGTEPLEESTADGADDVVVTGPVEEPAAVEPPAGEADELPAETVEDLPPTEEAPVGEDSTIADDAPTTEDGQAAEDSDETAASDAAETASDDEKHGSGPEQGAE